MTPAFVINFCEDQAAAEKVVARLKAWYPESAVLAIKDEPRLKVQEFGGQWTERWMKAFVEQTNAPICIKVDPDTGVCKVLTDFPAAELFGAVGAYPDGTRQVLGGAMGVTREATTKILESGLLRDARYQTPEYTYLKNNDRVSYQDKIIADICKRLSLKIADWHDVWMHFHQSPADPARYGFVHPISN